MLDPSESGALYVRVATEDGEPLPGVTVTITYQTSQLERVTVTDADGEERFLAIPPGVYDLRAEREGFNPVNKPDIEVRIGQETSVEIVMR